MNKKISLIDIYFVLFILAANEESLLTNVGEQRREEETNELISFDSDYFTPSSFPPNNPFENQTNNVKKQNDEKNI